MEINQEALDALSLADLFALESYCKNSLKILGGGGEEICNSFRQMNSAISSELSKRISNVFIF